MATLEGSWTFQVSKEEAEAFKRFWCQCEDPDPENQEFKDDDECSCGVHKHHYHCTVCGKITQVG